MSLTPEVPLAANYDNNNEANASKMKAQHTSLQQQHRCASAAEPRRGSTSKAPRTRGVGACGGRLHLNSLWSVWYGFFGTFLQAYTAVKCTKRFLRYSVLPWTSPAALWELHACLLVTGLAVLLLPLFLASAVFKIGNHANDGFKLGRTSSICDKDPPSSLLGPRCSLWRHGGPTAAFLHLVIAFSLLVPKLVMEARLVQGGFLPSDTIWRTDLDFMVVHHDRLVVLSFMTATSSGNGTTVVPVSTSVESVTSTSVLNSTKVPPVEFNFMKMLKDFFSMESPDSNVDSGFGSSVSVEYLNYALALFVYSVRYPAIFWNTNKCFGIIFSVQLLANSLQSLLAFAGMSVLYKVQIIGAWKALPLLRHYPDGMSPLGGRSPFLLNPHVTLALFALSSLLVLSSSLILYLYGHGRFNSFLNQQKDRKHIFVSPTSHHHSWGYFTHCAALCVLVAVAVAYAPLLYDYTVVYRGSLDGAVLACIVASISHLFLWVLVWLFLTIKHRWTFKLRVTVGRATVRSARNVKLVTDIDLVGCRSEEGVQQPLLIVGNGRTYTVSEHSPKKAIMSVIQKAAMDKKSKNSTATSSVGGSSVADDDPEEQIYWLRPALVTPQRSPDSGSEDRLCWFSSSSRRKQGGQHKHKVTFNEASSTSNIRNPKGLAKPSKLRSSGNGGVDEDDGDYATLRELPLIPMVHPDLEDDTTSEEGGKLLACVRDDNVTYASTSRDLIPPGDYEDPSPLLTPEPLSDREDQQPTTARLTTAAAVNKTNNPVTVTIHTQLPMAQTPRCLRRADSGMPPEELTPRSDSISTESSSSPPEPPGSNHSETSSGVHSNASNNSDHIHHHQQQLPLPPPPAQLLFNHPQLAQQQPILNHQLSQVIASRRTASVVDLAGQKDDNQWKSCSLQRNVQPPNFRGQNGSSQGARVDYSAAPSSLTRNIEPGYGYAGAKAQNLKNDGANYGYASQNIRNDNSNYGLNNSTSQNLKNDGSNFGFNNSPTQNLKNDGSNYSYNNSTTQNIKNESSNYGSNSQIPKTNSSSYIHNNLNSQSPKVDPSAFYNHSNPQNSKMDPSGYGFTKSNPQTQNIDHSGYNYNSFNSHTPKKEPVNFNSNSQQDSSGFQVIKTESHEAETHRRNSSYGYSPVIKPEQIVRHNSIYGGSAPITTNNSETITVRASIYGYTTTGSVTSDTNDVVQYSPSTSQQGLYGYTVKPNNNDITSPPNGIYGFTKAKVPQGDVPEHGIPVILENTESTVVIRRKAVKPLAVVETIPVITEEPFGRSTNMKMTSFTENNDLKNIQSSSATLPHYPTQPMQPQNQYPHCSTMPLPHNNQTGTPPPNLGAGTSCNVYPRQHSTIPTHHNGVRLFPPNQNPYTKRIQNIQNGGIRGSSEGIYGSTNGQKPTGDIYHYNS